MNILIREMKTYTKSLIFWSIGSILLVVSGMAKFDAASSSAQSMNEILSKMPKSLQGLVGGGAFDLSKISGYFGVLVIYIVLTLTIHAAMMGANIISKEERDKTSEFLFVKPASRSKIISAKLCAGILNILILNIVTSIASFAIVNSLSNGEDVNADIAKIMFGMFILQIMFLFLGTAISALVKNPKLPLSITTGTLLTMYMISMAIDISSDFEPLKYFTPFKYFEAKDLMYGGDFQIAFVILSILIIGICGFVTYSFYKKRDLNI